STRSLRHAEHAPSPSSATSSTPPPPGTPAPSSSCATRSKTTPALHKRSPMSGVLGLLLRLSLRLNQSGITAVADRLFPIAPRGRDKVPPLVLHTGNAVETGTSAKTIKRVSVLNRGAADRAP